jgi:hypothetical protein
MKLLPWSLILLAATLRAQSPPPKYAVINTKNNEAYVARLNQLADQGFRVLIVNKYTVLRLDAAPPDTYRYLRLEVKGGPVEFTNWINDRGAHGYRWRSGTGLLEKAPHPRNFEYSTAPHSKLHLSRPSDFSTMVEQGYRPLDPISFQHSLGPSSSEVFFERDLDQPAPPQPRYPGTAIALAEGQRAGTVLKGMAELAKRGYRFGGPHETNAAAYMAVMMEKCPDECSGRYEYRYFDAKSRAQVERSLNAFGKDGFRVIPSGLTRRPHVLERDTRAKQEFVYRVLDPIDAADLEQHLNAADNAAFVPLGFVWHSGFSTAQAFLVLEKEITASANP